ncbi:hypothetical protein L6164_033243 [Bauhinia variegata]|uniref:Uncharacterized protein n=1 Tax=Bauhinia variegata TaxID=167791 RepID=A0ACB9KS00_BAUVA|nr:hypothetical protein L6164_033243 [Bauhinia variegata]
MLHQISLLIFEKPLCTPFKDEPHLIEKWRSTYAFIQTRTSKTVCIKATQHMESRLMAMLSRKEYKKNSRPELNLAAEFKPQKMAALNQTFKIFRAQSKPKRKGLHKHDLPQTNILADSNTSCGGEINVPANLFSLKNQKIPAPNSGINPLLLKPQKIPCIFQMLITQAGKTHNPQTSLPNLNHKWKQEIIPTITQNMQAFKK